MMVDSDHIGDEQRARSDFMVFANNALINWYAKKPHTIDSSVFGAYIFALKICMETVRGLNCK